MVKVAVIGAGVVGISTAVRIQDFNPEAEVTVLADKFFEETTSHGAGGIFRPLYSKQPGVPREKLRNWLQTSWDHLFKLAWSPQGGDAGVSTVSGYTLWNSEEKELPISRHFTDDFRFLRKEELQRFPVKYKFGTFHSTLVCECRRYLPFLTKIFKSRNGSFIRKHVNSLDELVEAYDVIVNCAGLGSRTLLGDTSVIPLRGHLIRAKLPGLKHFLYTDEDCHLIPGIDSVIIGFTKTPGSFDTIPNQRDHDAILERACRIYPPLKGVDKSTVSSWVGLRPFREEVRLETEYMDHNSKITPVIHNYGHGAEGVSLSWGTATDAAKLVQNALKGLLAKAML